MLSVVMTTTRTRLRKKVPFCRAGLGEKFPLSLAKNTWMDGKASYFHGTGNTDQFMKKHCCITLILIKGTRNLFWKRKLKYWLLHWSPNRYVCVCTLLHVKFWNTFNICTPEFAYSCVVMTALLFRLNQKGRLAVYLVTY